MYNQIGKTKSSFLFNQGVTVLTLKNRGTSVTVLPPQKGDAGNIFNKILILLNYKISTPVDIPVYKSLPDLQSNERY